VITQYELEERLIREDETVLLELLDLNSEDIVNAFKDKIEERFFYIVKELELE